MMVNYRAVARQYAPKEFIRLYRLLRNKFQPPDPWITHIQSLFQRDIQPKLGKSNLSTSAKKVFFWTPYTGFPFMFIEYCIATNLRLRGHEVDYFLCDGSLPHCGYEGANHVRPDCTNCWAKSEKIQDAFSLCYQKLSDFVSPQEIKNITENLTALPEDLAQNYVQDNVKLGQNAFQSLSAYYQGPIVEYGKEEKYVFRKLLIANAIGQIYAQRVIEKARPDVVVMLNGHASLLYPAFCTFKNHKIPMVVWDEAQINQDSFYFMQNRSIQDTGFEEELWLKLKNEPLTEDQEAKVEAFLENWPKGNDTGIVYHPQPIKSVIEIRNKIGLQDNKPVFVAFTNVIWDTAVLGQDVGFSGMMDWLYQLIEWFTINTDKQLVIRVHPAEKRLPPSYRTNNGVSTQVRQRFKEKLDQGNIFIVDADDDIYSYSLAEIADAVCIYTTTLGMELAAVGMKPWIAGNVHYRDKGFTLDIKNISHLYQELEKITWIRNNSIEEKTIARRYLYARIERQLVRIPFLKRFAAEYTLPYFHDLNFLGPGNDPLIDALTDRILDGQPFIDIPRTSNINFASY